MGTPCVSTSGYSLKGGYAHQAGDKIWAANNNYNAFVIGKPAYGNVPGDNKKACTPYSTCQSGAYISTRGTTSTDRKCGQCGVNLYTHDIDELECVAWEPCEIDYGVADYGSGMDDVECSECEKGYISLSVDPFSRCTKLIDSDGDGLYDRNGPGYADTRDAPGTGGEYDKCPFDPYNDWDGDGICGDVDECPKDPKNDKDKDGICGDKDDVDWTLDFRSNSLVGWKKDGDAFVGQPTFVDEGAFEDYAGDTVCPGCYVHSKIEGEGEITSKAFTLKRNTVEFFIGGGGPDHMESVEVVLVDDKDGDKVLKKTMPAGTGDDSMFPVFLDVAEHKGKEVFFRVSDRSVKGGIKFDNIQFYNDQGGCLPECLKIEATTCGPEDNLQTCFKFENDETPYVRVKRTSAKSEIGRAHV